MVLVALGVLIDSLCQVCDGQPATEIGDKLPLSTECATGPKVAQLGKPIRWKDREYDISGGIDVLMSAIRDAETHKERELALLTLSMASPDLGGRACLDDLATMFDNAEGLNKQIILTCFLGSRDPRGIPVFIRTLQKEHNIKLRLSAAAGLAQWNLRRGVAELVKLLDSQEEMPQPSQLFYVRDNAMRTFRLKNIHKGWGFPDDKESAEWPPDVMPPPEAAARLRRPPSVGEIKAWWIENERRFPEWKPGDPLPEVDKDALPSKENPAP